MTYATSMYLAATLRPVYRQAEMADGRRLVEPILVDDCEDVQYLDAVGYALRGLSSALEPAVPLVLKPEFGNSAKDECLQLVDMVCGAVGDHLEGNSTAYKQIRTAGLGIDAGCGPGVAVHK